MTGFGFSFVSAAPDRVGPVWSGLEPDLNPVQLAGGQPAFKCWNQYVDAFRRHALAVFLRNALVQIAAQRL